MKAAALSLLTFLCSDVAVTSAAMSAEEYVEQKVLTSDQCTTIAIGRKATLDGSTMCTDTMDCAECDWRVGKVPAIDHPEGSMRAVYAESSQYPRYIRTDRGSTWYEENLEQKPNGLAEKWAAAKTAVIGYIPQVAHTYAVLEGMYGFMNEHQVSMGESTCAAKLYSAPIGWNDGKALFNIGELTQVGMERGKTAREAIQVMGDIATKYGFYGESWDPASIYGIPYVMGEAGEALSVIDPEEAWIFHVLPDDTGASAVWVAQRVPDHNVAVVANSFIIRHVIPDSDDFMYSDNLWEVAKRMGFWNEEEDELMDFKLAYSPERYHPDYSNNRVWRVFDLANPSAQLSMYTNADADDYPFSMPVDHLLTLHDVMGFNRDQYEGTPLSLTEGMAAGPFGDPNRYTNHAYGTMTLRETLDGAFARPISLFRTSTSIVAQARNSVPNELGRVWVSAYAPDVSSYTPMYVSTTEISTHWSTGSMHIYDSNVAWWNFAVVGNYVARYYHFAIDSVRKLQSNLQSSFDEECVAIEKKVMKILESGDEDDKAKVTSMLTDFTVKKGDEVSLAWKEFFPYLLTTYRDGFIVTENAETLGVRLTAMFYPEWWLKAVGYFDSKPNTDPAAILFASNPSTGDNFVVRTVSLSSLFMACFVCAIGFGMSGYYFAKKSFTNPDQSNDAGVWDQFSSRVSSKISDFGGAHRGYSSIEQL